jgi:large subunit ribosomal protein L23
MKNKKNEQKTNVVFKDYDLIKYPVITEKTNLMGQYGQYFFAVRKEATKRDIKMAIERVFDVKVKSVNTLIYKGKIKRFRGHAFLRSDVKKAIVRLEDGYSIALNTGV